MLSLTLSCLLFIIGGIYSVVNWVIFFHNLRVNSKYSSYIPFLGGISIYCAFWLLDLKEYRLLGLFIDFSCFPSIICAFLFYAFKCVKQVIKWMFRTYK